MIRLVISKPRSFVFSVKIKVFPCHTFRIRHNNSHILPGIIHSQKLRLERNGQGKYRVGFVCYQKVGKLPTAVIVKHKSDGLPIFPLFCVKRPTSSNHGSTGGFIISSCNPSSAEIY